MTNHAVPTIEHIETIIFTLPMRGALQWGTSSRMTELKHVLVRVCLSDGSEGLAEAPPRPTIYGETASTICSIIKEELMPRIAGLPVIEQSDADPSPISASMVNIQSRLHQVKNNHAAKGALDIAIHDAVAQHLHIPLSRRLGAQREKIRVSYILGIGNRDTVIQEAERVTHQGVRVLKVKVGRDWDDDIARIVELQNTLGADVELYADANETMQPENAAARLAQLAEMGLLYCEEPLPVTQIRSRASLQSGHHLPIIADDSAFTLQDLLREIENNTFDILNIKTARTGYTESMQMLNAARNAGKGIMVGSQASAGLGTARAALCAALNDVEHPAELSFPLKLEADIIDRAIKITDGYMQLADADAVSVNPQLLRSAMTSN